MNKHYLTSVSARKPFLVEWRGWLWVMLLMASFTVPLASQAQQIISGTIKDAKGESLPGAGVLIKSTSRGTATDQDGKYQLAASAGEVLVATFTGYKSQEITVGAETNINFTLEEDGVLDEVIVVGYGTQNKKDVTGAVTKLTEKDFNQGPIVNPLQKLAGRAAGVNITQSGSEPGVRPSVRIRGITSLQGSSDPLVVVDGIQGNMDLLSQIPPSEIESIDVLKDASATAIYGTRGTSGVILVTTKKGKGKGREVKTTVEYSGVASVERIAKKYDMLDATAWRAEATRRGIATSADFGGNTDWFKEITRGGFTQTHNLAFGGGSNNFNYRASATAILQDGVIKGSGSQSYIARLEATQRALNDKLSLTFSVNAATGYNKYNGPGVVGTALTRRPTDPIYNTDGSYFNTPSIFNYVNPQARVNEIIDGGNNNSLFGTIRAEYEIIDGLTAAWFGSWRKTDNFYGGYQSPKTTLPDAMNQKGIATRSGSFGDEKLTNFIVNYRKVVGDHSFGGMLGYEWQRATYDGFASTGRGFINDFFSFNALQASDVTAARSGDISSYKNDQTLVSFFGRFNYTYKGKYMATATFRRDGSSKFGANNKWANFPSMSLAWIISEESFLKDVTVINSLKLRAGYGVTGSQAGLGPLNSQRLVRPSGTAFFEGNVIPNFAITQNQNQDLRWETRGMFNAGLDFALLDSKLTGTVDFYIGSTKDLLFDYIVPQPPYPFPTIKANIGKMQNQGIELSLNYNLIDKEDFGITLGGNFASNRNTIKELSGSLNGIELNTNYVRWGGGYSTGVASQNNGASYLVKGQPLGAFYLFGHGGVTDSGTQIIQDINGDGKIDDGDTKINESNVLVNNPDRQFSGQPLPKFTWAFTPTVRYKDFDLSFVFRGAGGHKIYNSSRASLSAMTNFGQANVLQSALVGNITDISYASNYWLENGSFARMENLTMGYKVRVGDSKYISDLRFSVTANNLFVITKYSGIDPEIRVDGNGGLGIDGGIYPRTRNFAVGVNVILK